jgi:hypothetical protein
MLRYLCVATLVCGMAGVAKADDFKMVVVDPTPSFGEVHDITSDSFSVTLSACHSDQGVDPTLYLGCFTGLNLSGAPLTNLQLLIPAFDISPGLLDTPGCGLVTPLNLNVFPDTPQCGTTSNNQYFYVDFSGGNLPSAVNNGDCDHDNDSGHLNQDDINCDTGSIFTIAVGFGTACTSSAQCLDETTQLTTDFTGTEAEVNVTPEPSSVLLMSTGVLSIGLFGACRRRYSLVRRLRYPAGTLN